MLNDMWHYVRGEDYCEKVTDGTHDTPKPVARGKYLVTSKHIKGDEIDFENAYFISEDDFHEINKRSKVDQWDVIISMIGAYCGFCFIERNPNVNYTVKNVGLFKTGNELDAKWLYYYLNSSAGKAHLDAAKSGSSQPYIALGALRELPILTPKDNRVKGMIVSVVDCISEKIRTNNRINAELEAMAKTLYDYWFVQFDFPFDFASGKPAQNGKPYKTSGGKMVYNPTLKREIPAGWKAGLLGQFVELERGVTYGKEDVCSSHDRDSIGILRATNVTGNIIDVNDLVYVPVRKVSSTQTITKFETLIVMSSGSKEHVGKNGIYYFDEPFGFGAFCSKITADANSRYFVNTFLQTDWFKAYIKNQCLGTNINNLTNNHIEDCPKIKPHEKAVSLFEDTVQACYGKIASNTIQNQYLTQLRDWLLPMLMNGQVTVNPAQGTSA